MISIVPTFQDVLYVLGNDLHRGRVRSARVIQRHPDGSADLVVFAEPNEAANETGSSDRDSSGVFVKTRVPCDPTGARPVSWREDPDAPVEALGRIVDEQDQQLQLLVDEVAKLRERLERLETPAPATPTPPSAAPPAAAA